jgi:hypothetical protein
VLGILAPAPDRDVPERRADPEVPPDIGKRFNRDHTTVIHAIKTVQKRMLADPEIEADVKALRERLAA